MSQSGTQIAFIDNRPDGAEVCPNVKPQNKRNYSSFAVLDLLYLVSSTPRVDLITRLRLGAQLYDPAPERKVGQTGRPRVKGARRPSPQQALDDPKTKWAKIEVDICTADKSARSKSTPRRRSGIASDVVKVPRSLLERLTDAVCYAA